MTDDARQSPTGTRLPSLRYTRLEDAISLSPVEDMETFRRGGPRRRMPSRIFAGLSKPVQHWADRPRRPGQWQADMCYDGLSEVCSTCSAAPLWETPLESFGE